MKILILFLTLWSCNNTESNQMKSNELLFNVDFQDFFEKDKVTFFLNDCLVFKELELNSDKSVGLANMLLKINKVDTSYVVNVKQREDIICKIDKDSISLKIIVNQVASVFTINLNKGKYIGFDKGENNKVELNQSIRPFEYD